MRMKKEFADNLTQLALSIPKVELHLHLEGAIPLQTLFELIQETGDEPSIKTVEDLQKKLMYTDFAHFIQLWLWKNRFIKEEKTFERITYEVLYTLHNQNVKYVEAFYSPSDYQQQGLSPQKITEYIIKGKQRAYNDFGIRCELIMDIVRGDGVKIGFQRLEEVTPYLRKGVIGIGLGGSEQKFPADPYGPVYKEAKHRGFRLTAHAGEAAGAESIWAVITKLGVDRIGHGVSAYEDPQLVSLLKERQIPLEMCVVSNVKTKVCESFKAHPITQYYQQGLLITVNSDDPTMFNTTISAEYNVLARKLGFSLHDLKRVSINGITASFMPEMEKESMKSQFEKEWEHILAKY